MKNTEEDIRITLPKSPDIRNYILILGGFFVNMCAVDLMNEKLEIALVSFLFACYCIYFGWRPSDG